MRPRTPPALNGDVARGRMAPNGLVKPYSQSTIPRPAIRRVRKVQTPPAPTYLGMDKQTYSSDAEVEFFHAVGIIQEGDPVLVFLHGHGSITAPTGWTVIASGTVNDMNYLAAWIPFEGAVDEMGFYSGPLDMIFDISAATMLLTFSFHGAGTPAATVYEHPATTSINTPATPPPGYAAPWSLVGIQWDTGWTVSGGLTTESDQFTTYQASRLWSIVQGDAETVPGYDPAGGAITINGSGSPLPDFVAVMFGWT